MLYRGTSTTEAETQWTGDAPGECLKQHGSCLLVDPKI